MLCLALALLCDGVTGGMQDSMKADYSAATEKATGKKLKLKPCVLVTARVNSQLLLIIVTERSGCALLRRMYVCVCVCPSSTELPRFPNIPPSLHACIASVLSLVCGCCASQV